MLKIPADTVTTLMSDLDRREAGLLRYLDAELRHIRESRERLQALCDHDWNDCRRCTACGVWKSEIPKESKNE